MTTNVSGASCAAVRPARSKVFRHSRAAVTWSRKQRGSGDKYTFWGCNYALKQRVVLWVDDYSDALFALKFQHRKIKIFVLHGSDCGSAHWYYRVSLSTGKTYDLGSDGGDDCNDTYD